MTGLARDGANRATAIAPAIGATAARRFAASAASRCAIIEPFESPVA